MTDAERAALFAKWQTNPPGNPTTQAFTRKILDGSLNRLMTEGAREGIAATAAARKKQPG